MRSLRYGWPSPSYMKGNGAAEALRPEGLQWACGRAAPAAALLSPDSRNGKVRLPVYGYMAGAAKGAHLRPDSLPSNGSREPHGCRSPSGADAIVRCVPRGGRHICGSTVGHLRPTSRLWYKATGDTRVRMMSPRASGGWICGGYRGRAGARSVARDSAPSRPNRCTRARLQGRRVPMVLICGQVRARLGRRLQKRRSSHHDALRQARSHQGRDAFEASSETHSTREERSRGPV